MTRVAIDALQKDDTSQALIAQPCMILSNGAELSPEQRTSVLESVARRLTAACATPDVLTEMVSTSESFSWLTVPNLVTDSPLNIVRIQIQLRAGGQSSMTLELLNLAANLKATTDVQPQLDLIMKETQDTLEIVREAVKNGRSFPIPLGLHWPDLTFTHGGFGERATDSPSPITAIWGTHQPSKRDWLEYLILLHPAMQDTVTAALEELK